MKNRNAWRRWHWLAYTGRDKRLRDLSGSAIKVYLLIDCETRRNNSGCTLSDETMGLELNLHPRTIRRAISELQTVGLVFSLRRPHQTSVRYSIDPLDADAIQRVLRGIEWHGQHQGRSWARSAVDFFHTQRDRSKRLRNRLRRLLHSSRQNAQRNTHPTPPLPVGGQICPMLSEENARGGDDE